MDDTETEPPGKVVCEVTQLCKIVRVGTAWVVVTIGRVVNTIGFVATAEDLYVSFFHRHKNES